MTLSELLWVAGYFIALYFVHQAVSVIRHHQRIVRSDRLVMGREFHGRQKRQAERRAS